MSRWWTLPLGAVGITGLIGLGMWLSARGEPPPPFKTVDVRVEAAEDVCWIVEDGPKDPFDPNALELIRCGSGYVGYDDDLVAVPSSLVIRKTQDNEAPIRAWFSVNEQITDSGKTDDPGGAIYLSGT